MIFSPSHLSFNQQIFFLLTGASLDSFTTYDINTVFVNESSHCYINLFSDSYSKPSSALLHIIDKIPRAFLDRATQTILEDTGQQQGESKAVVGLQNMIQWLCVQPAPSVVSEWILRMLKGLQENERNSILIEIAHGAVETVRLNRKIF